MSMEQRSAGEPVEVRSAEGQPTTIRGYAAVFGTEAVIGGLFRERIEPGAFRSVLESAGMDVRAAFNHDDNIILGRTTNGTLRLVEDARGLAYEVDLNPDDPQAMSVVAKLKRGDVTGSSFRFYVKPGTGEAWTRPTRMGEMPLRTIKEFRAIKDVGPVSFPAYGEATAEVRSAAEVAALPEIVEAPDFGVERARIDLLECE